MLKFSTGLKFAILGDGGFSRAMGGGIVRVFSGVRPVNADSVVPVDCVELGRITTLGRIFYPGADTEGAGLVLRLILPEYIESEGVWTLKCINTGMATWFRWNWSGVDDNVASTVLPRVDGDVGTADMLGDLTLANINLIEGQSFNLDVFVGSLGMI